VALVGSTGCGKSTCMSLLQRLYEPQSGSVLIDGLPLAAYDIQHLRSRIVIVDQSTVLFHATIKDNITYGMPNADAIPDVDVINALKGARAWDDFVDKKPDKLMTMITSRGSNLSGGQRQRLAIARAMVRKPDVILLDEATSALDNENEAKVQEALDELMKLGSALVIAHRLSTVMDSDNIVVVDKGRVVEQGTHVELLAKTDVDDVDDVDDVKDVKDADAEAASLSSSSDVTEGEVECSYRLLWDAANGKSQGDMSYTEMNQKIGALEDELKGLKGRRRKILKEKMVRSQLRRTVSDQPQPLSVAQEAVRKMEHLSCVPNLPQRAVSARW